jgi:hypothetical protein
MRSSLAEQAQRAGQVHFGCHTGICAERRWQDRGQVDHGANRGGVKQARRVIVSPDVAGFNVLEGVGVNVHGQDAVPGGAEQ